MSRARWAAVAVVLLASTAASAQIGSGISGVVRDTSGAVLPGVTVEVASPVLIEGSRSTITDSGGQYQIIDLRPGDYTVTFTLPGFRTVRREGIRLTAAFTATVNTELQVGAARRVDHRLRAIAAGRRPRVGLAVGDVARDARHDSNRQGSVRGRTAHSRRHHQHARRRRHADHAAADAAGARVVQQRQRVHGRQRADSAHRLRRQSDRLLFQRRPDGRDLATRPARCLRNRRSAACRST